MVRKVGSNHYVATTAAAAVGAAGGPRDGHWTDVDGDDRSHRTDLTSNGYFVHNHARHVMPSWEEPRRGRSLDALHERGYSPTSARSGRSARSARSGRSGRSGRSHASRRSRSHHRDDRDDIYITSQAYHHPPSYSNRSYRGGSGGPLVAPSEMSTRSKVSRKGGVVVETMSAPNPFCPNTRGCCCLLLLINLAIILITLGFVVVLQFFQPTFVWILGIIFLIFGFIALAVSLVYCVWVCKDAKSPRQVAQEDHYWTRHWQKNFALPEIHYQGEKSRPYSTSASPGPSDTWHHNHHHDTHHHDSFGGGCDGGGGGGGGCD